MTRNPPVIPAAAVARAAPAAAAPYLQIDRLVKSFDGVHAVDGIDLHIAQGEIFALLGSSGCGKSTLLRMLAGFETPTSGRIVLDGQDITRLPPYQRTINMMFQSYALFPHLSVYDNVAFGLRRERVPAPDIVERVNQMLALVQMSAYARRKPHQLSGGQQQRVALARSLAKRPRLLLLDEPLGALDKKLRERTQSELVNIIHQVGVTCVMVTHDQEEAMSMASRIAVMSAGRIRQVGKPADIYETPNCRFVADFIGNINLFDGMVDDVSPGHVLVTSADCRHHVGHGISGNVGMAVTVGLRPEKIQLSRTTPPRDHNCVRGKVVELAYLGSHTVYHVQLASGMVIKASATNAERHAADSPQAGDTVFATWADDAMVVLTQ